MCVCLCVCVDARADRGGGSCVVGGDMSTVIDSFCLLKFY